MLTLSSFIRIRKWTSYPLMTIITLNVLNYSSWPRFRNCLLYLRLWIRSIIWILIISLHFTAFHLDIRSNFWITFLRFVSSLLVFVLLLLFLFLFLFLLAFLTQLLVLFRQLWLRERYSYSTFALLASWIFFFRVWKRLRLSLVAVLQLRLRTIIRKVFLGL